MKLCFAVACVLFGIASVTGQFCPSLDLRSHIGPGSDVCCDSLIKTVVETGMNTLNLFGASGPTRALGLIVQSVQQFVQEHFGIPFEVIMSPIDFQLNSHYNGTRICKFKSKDFILAVYESPGKYDIHSSREKFFSNFAVNDKLNLGSIANAAYKEAANIGGLSENLFG